MTREDWKREGWTLAGGIWGEAAWKQPRPDLVIGLADESLSVPVDGDTRPPIIVQLYNAPFYPEWRGLSDGEAPCGCDPETAGRASYHRFDTLGQALAFVSAIEKEPAA